MVQDSQNGLCAKSLQRQRVLSAWIPDLLTFENSEYRATLNCSSYRLLNQVVETKKERIATKNGMLAITHFCI